MRGHVYKDNGEQYAKNSHSFQIIEQLRINNKMWMLMRLKEYERKWKKMHTKERKF